MPRRNRSLRPSRGVPFDRWDCVEATNCNFEPGCDCDGTVGITDFLEMLATWGPC